MTALDAALTATGTVLGTPRYMPPEQMTGLDLDARSDQFSFCVALYEALYGRHPLRDGTSRQMLDQGDRAAPPPEGNRVPAAIGRVVLRGLEPDRARRFPSMSALIDELVPRPRRAPVRSAALAIGSVLVVGGAVAAEIARQPGPPVAAAEAASVDGLLEEKLRKEHERQVLIEALERARVEHRAEIESYRVKLDRKNEEIRALGDMVSELQTRNRALESQRPGRAAASAPNNRVSAVVDLANGPVRGCFDEWADRNAGTQDEQTDATLVVRLTVTPDGVGTLPVVLASPDEHPILDGERSERGPSILELCASEQLARVPFPPGPDMLEAEVTVRWSPGRVTLSARVVGRRPAQRHAIDP
jgi:hypothetical protein